MPHFPTTKGKLPKVGVGLAQGNIMPTFELTTSPATKVPFHIVADHSHHFVYDQQRFQTADKPFNVFHSRHPASIKNAFHNGKAESTVP